MKLNMRVASILRHRVNWKKTDLRLGVTLPAVINALHSSLDFGRPSIACSMGLEIAVYVAPAPKQ